MKAKNRHNVLALLSKIACVMFILQGWFYGSSVYAQSSSTSATGGKEFYISFLHNYERVTTLQLKVIVEKACYITAKYNNQANTYWNNWNNTLVAPGIYTVNVSHSDVINTVTGISFKTITLTSTEDVCVYAINYYTASTDGTCILPVPTWGTEYRLATGHPVGVDNSPGIYAVIAKEDNTELTTHTGTQVILNKDEVYHFYGAAGVDLTGMKITATKPVALFSGAGLTWGPGQSSGFGCPSTLGGGSASADHTYEQLWSADKWGRDFFAWPILTPNAYGKWGGMLALVAQEDGTNITVSGGINGGTPLSYMLNAGEKQYVCHVMSGLTRIVSDKPIMAFLVLPDACIMNIPATDQRITHALVAPFILSGTTNISSHGIDLLIPAAYWDQTVIKHDGVVVSNSLYTVTPSTHFPDWYTVRKDLSNIDIAIDITCPGGFLAYISGNGSAETYAFAAGAGAFDLSAYFTVDETPHQAIDGAVFCGTGTHAFEAIIWGYSTAPGFLKWYINGVEETAARDQFTWNKHFANGVYTIRMDVIDMDGVLHEYSTTFSVDSPVPAITIQATPN